MQPLIFWASKPVTFLVLSGNHLISKLMALFPFRIQPLALFLSISPPVKFSQQYYSQLTCSRTVLAKSKLTCYNAIQLLLELIAIKLVHFL